MGRYQPAEADAEEEVRGRPGGTFSIYHSPIQVGSATGFTLLTTLCHSHRGFSLVFKVSCLTGNRFNGLQLELIGAKKTVKTVPGPNPLQCTGLKPR